MIRACVRHGGSPLGFGVVGDGCRGVIRRRACVRHGVSRGFTVELQVFRGGEPWGFLGGVFLWSYLECEMFPSAWISVDLN